MTDLPWAVDEDTLPAFTSAPVAEPIGTPGPDNEQYIEGLRSLMACCEGNANVQADTMIEACLGDGMQSRGEIVQIGRRLGFHYGHVVIRLDKGAGSIFGVHRWRRDGPGRYALLTEGDAPTPIDASHIKI